MTKNSQSTKTKPALPTIPKPALPQLNRSFSKPNFRATQFQSNARGRR